MTWTLPLLFVALWQLGTPTALDSELALWARGNRPVMQMLVADATLKAQLFAWMASVQEALGDEKAAVKARDAAEEALELALTDRETARHFLVDARALLALGRAPRDRGPARSAGDPPLADRTDPDSGGSVEGLEQLRAELRDARSPH